ncbi:MAG TPA: DUF362 domain-containing protein [Thermoleophilia bacterium]|nr:DUF362 domain-containing protein [Thermoleophilia bacterium]
MAQTPLTRAEFLKILAAGSAGVLFLGGAEEALAGITGTNDALDQAALDGDARAAHAAGTVLAVAKGTSASSNVQRAIAAVGGMRRFVHAGDTVVIKPNICATRAPQYAATTNPQVVATLVSLARAAGAGKVVVMDNPISADPTAAYSASGIASAVRAAKGSMKVMSRAPSAYRNYAMPGHFLGNFPIYPDFVNADVLINVPIVKQHGSTGLTIAGKNLMGCTWNRGKMHQSVSQGIAELNAKLRPELTVVDAMRILVRNGPTGGSLADVKVKNTVLACTDWVAADTYAASRIFGVSAAQVPYIKAAANMHLGTMNLASVVIRNV